MVFIQLGRLERTYMSIKNHIAISTSNDQMKTIFHLQELNNKGHKTVCTSLFESDSHELLNVNSETDIQRQDTGISVSKNPKFSFSKNVDF